MAAVPIEAALAFAFGGGIAMFFSPCSVVLLPAYIAYYSGRDDGTVPMVPDHPETPPGFVRGFAIALGGGALAVGATVAAILFRELPLGVMVLLAAAGVTLAAAGALLAGWAAASLGEGDRIQLLADSRRGAKVGAWTSLGILLTFVALGLPFLALGSIAASFAARWIPVVAFSVAAILVVLGAAMALGRKIPTVLPRIMAPRSKTAASFFAFGIGYALVATGCFLPVFVSVVALLLTQPLLGSAAILLAFAGAVAMMMLFTSVYAATARGAAMRSVRTVIPHVHQAAGLLILASATFTLWFDWTFALSPEFFGA